MGYKFHIDGTQEFGYSTVNRYLYSLYFYMNSVDIICDLCNNYAPVNWLKGYVAHFCYVRLKSFDTFIKVAVEHKDHVSACCLLRMLGDSVAVFRLVYMEPDEDLRILRHCLYVLDGCKRSLDVLPLEKFNKGSVPDVELEELDRQIKYNREHRERMMREVQEMLDKSPLRIKDEDAFNKIVEDCNWKFKEFKNYRRINSNQYQWKELYKMIGRSKYIDLLSFFSQYSHGLSMSNLNVEPDQSSFDGIIGEAVSLLDLMNQYVLKFFEAEKDYIYEGLLRPEIRDKILACFDDKHRPDIFTWEQGIINKRSELYFNSLRKV